MNRYLGTETVTVLTPVKAPDHDGYGNDVYVETSVRLPGCRLEPRTSSEDNAARAQVITGMWLYAPGTVLRVDSAILARGQRWEIDGEPGVWQSTGNRWTYQQAALRKVTG